MTQTSLLTKPCIECKIEKQISEFYAHPSMKDGTVNVCKACHKQRMKTRRRSNPYVQEFDRKRASTPERKLRAKKYLVRWRKENPDGNRAHKIVQRAVENGKLIKQPCIVCGDSKVHAHHEDYSKPLDVIWLCALHHHRGHADGVIG